MNGRTTARTAGRIAHVAPPAGMCRPCEGEGLDDLQFCTGFDFPSGTTNLCHDLTQTWAGIWTGIIWSAS